MAVQIRGRQVMDSTITAAKLVLTDTFNFTSGAVQVAEPTAANHAASKGYVDSQLQGLSPKESVRVLSKTNINVSSAPAAIDGVTLSAAAKDRVALTNQNTGTEDGIYNFNGAGNAMTRASDADSFAKLQSAYFFVREGTSADEGFVQTAELTSFDSQVYIQFSSAGNITAGNGLVKSGNTLSVVVDNSSIQITGDTLSVKPLGISNAMLAGSIDNAKLINSSLTLGGVSISLGGTVAKPAFDLENATGYPASALTGTINNGGLANDSISLGGVSVALGSSDATPAFNLSDATNYPASALQGSVAISQLAASTISGVSLGQNLGSLSSQDNSGISMTSYNGSAANNSIKLDANSLPPYGGDIDTSSDSLLIIDSAASGASKKKGLGDFVSAIAGDGLFPSGGVASVFTDNQTLEVDSESNKVQVKALGISASQIANTTITIDKLAFSGKYETFTANGSQAAFDLAVAVDLDFKKFFTVAVNGLLMDYADNPSQKDQYKIDNSGGGAVGKISFGANLDNGDKVSIRYIQ